MNLEERHSGNANARRAEETCGKATRDESRSPLARETRPNRLTGREDRRETARQDERM